MKRKVIVIWVASLVLVLCGCQSKQETPNITTNINTPEVIEGVEENSPSETTQSKLYLVKCPAFNDEEYDYSVANKTIENILAQKMEYLLDGADDIAEFSSDYTIEMQSYDYISVLYKIYLNREDAAHPADIVFGINMDRTGQAVVLKDIFAVDQSLIDNFRTAWNEQVDEVLRNYLNRYTDQELLELLEGVDPVSSDISLYMTEDSVVILFPVPRAAGSYAYITLPKE